MHSISIKIVIKTEQQIFCLDSRRCIWSKSLVQPCYSANGEEMILGYNHPCHYYNIWIFKALSLPTEAAWIMSADSWNIEILSMAIKNSLIHTNQLNTELCRYHFCRCGEYQNVKPGVILILWNRPPMSVMHVSIWACCCFTFVPHILHYLTNLCATDLPQLL